MADDTSLPPGARKRKPSIATKRARNPYPTPKGTPAYASKLRAEQKRQEAAAKSAAMKGGTGTVKHTHEPKHSYIHYEHSPLKKETTVIHQRAPEKPRERFSEARSAASGNTALFTEAILSFGIIAGTSLRHQKKPPSPASMLAVGLIYGGIAIISAGHKRTANTLGALVVFILTLRLVDPKYREKLGQTIAKASPNAPTSNQTPTLSPDMYGPFLPTFGPPVPPAMGPPAPPTNYTGAGATAVDAALSQVGVPYVWGGETPGKGFDCSGLVQWAWGKAGVKIPRTTFAQIPALAPVKSMSDLLPGDLLYPYPGHVVMYIGAGKVVDAPHTGTVVQIQPMASSYFAMRRP